MRIRNAARDVRTIKLLLTTAEAEARGDGAEAPGAEHLLLAALALPDGSARRAFERAGYDPDDYRAAIARQHADALRAIGIEPGDETLLDEATRRAKPAGTGPLRTNASAQTVFKAAVALARADKHAPLAGAHVVLAITQLEHGTAVRTLQTMGVDRAAIAAAARHELESQPGD